MEEWRDISGFEGLYQASNLGRIRSLPRRVQSGRGYKKLIKGTILRDRFIKSGSKLIYKSACFWKNGQDSYHLIHRLIAQTFIPNPEGKSEVNHKDLDPLNNCVSNLEWATSHENKAHGRTFRSSNGVEAKHVKLTPHAVIDIRSKSLTYQEYMKKYGVSQTTISSIQRIATWKHL